MGGTEAWRGLSALRLGSAFSGARASAALTQNQAATDRHLLKTKPHASGSFKPPKPFSVFGYRSDFVCLRFHPGAAYP